MFCKTCGLSINENIMYCPGCGNKLDRNSLSLNPLPGYVVHSNNEDTTSINKEPEVIVIDNSDTDNSADTKSIASVQFNGSSDSDKNIDVTEQTSQQIEGALDKDTNDSISNQNSISDTDNSQDNTGLRFTDSSTKRNTYKVIASLLTMMTIVGVIVGVKIYSSKGNTDSNTTEFTDTSIDIVQATDLTPDDIVLEEDNFIISKSITVADKEYDSRDLQYLTDKITGVNVTLYKVDLNATDMQIYCDEQESAYQLQSDDILDVAYVGDVYRYHYTQGYYQYGVLYRDSLVIYEISDNIETRLCDEMAIDYFKTEGVIK